MKKKPEKEEDDKNRRTIKLASAVVIVNKRNTTPVILEIHPNQGSSNLNVAKAHRNVFSALKLNSPTLKIITSQNVTIDILLQFPEGNAYISILSDIIKDPQNSRIYINHKIESARSILDLKFGNRNDIINIFDTLTENDAFLKHKKFNSHKEHSICILSQKSSRITLRNTLHENIQELLMWIYLDDEESKPILIDMTNNEGKPTLKKELLYLPSISTVKK